jgi:uncharacterized repeat protein (TIGR01451 family)
MNALLARRFATRCFTSLAVLICFPRLLCAAPDIALQMSVDVAVPASGQPVEFTVKASNVGDAAATGVVVVDKLPPELTIPAGLAAFPSTGTYDQATGTWTVGSLDPGASATLVIPAVVAATSQPACSVNVAESSAAQDTHTANNRAVAAIRSTATDRCVDLQLSISRMSAWDCGSSMHLQYLVYVRNAGPDDASSAFVDVSQTPVIAPNLRFASSSCSGTRCAIAKIGAGQTYALELTSDEFPNKKDRTVTLQFATSSDETDYSSLNNQYTENRALPALQKCPEIPGLGNVGSLAVGGCFIATAAYGSPLEPHVVALREFRDRVLKRFAFGRAFVRFYYRHSPPVAAVIAQHAWLRFLVRMLLTPLVLAVAFPVRVGALLTIALVLIVGRRRRIGLKATCVETRGRTAPLR